MAELGKLHVSKSDLSRPAFEGGGARGIEGAVVGWLAAIIPVANMRNGYVLPTDNQYQLRFQFYREMRKHGISTNPHAIRHAWATHMLTNGADIMTVSFLMGHESVKTTERYAKVSNEMARHIYESINN